MKLRFTRKENRPRTTFSDANPCGPGVEGGFHAGRRVPSGGRHGRPRAGGLGGGKAPFINRAIALTPLITFLITLLIFSFHLLTSPALAAGEVAPSFGWPARGEVTTSFRAPRGPYGAGGHAGIDISLPRGSEVRASAPGTVSFAGGTPLGPCVSITHASGFKTTYVSLQATAVRRGEKVGRGQLVGASDGSKDRSDSSPHLHFGLFLNGQAIDPLPLLLGLLLDPGKCLFLGPWEDKGAIDAYFERHDQGGFLGSIGRGFGAAGRAVAGVFRGAAKAVGSALSAAWRWTCRAAAVVGRGLQSFYRHCIRPWFDPLWRGAVEVAKKVWSNRFVQALVAGIAAAAIICLAVAGLAVALGISAVTAVVAAVVGSVAAIGTALYYACTSGDSFSFTTCFLSSLAVGGAAAVCSLLFSYMLPLMGTGWIQLGWIGFAKAFLINGAVDAMIYIVFCLVTGREVSPLGVLSTFIIGGLLGGVGKLFMGGLLAEGAAQSLVAGFLSSGGALLSGESFTGMAVYLWALTVHFAHKAAYLLFCACSSFLADLVIRVSTGVMPSLQESLLSFTGGALAGGLGLAVGGKGIPGLLSRLSLGRLKFSSDFAGVVVSKLFTGGLKESFSNLIDRFRKNRKKLEEGLWWSEIGGDL